MTKKLFRTLVVVFLILVWMVRLYQEQKREEPVADHIAVACVEEAYTDSLTLMRTHKRAWLEYTWNDEFCTQYSLEHDSVLSAAYFRANSKVRNWQNDDDFWREIYKQLYFHDRFAVSALQDSLQRRGSGLDRDAFARMVVAFVQDIPYNYIMPKGCEGYDSHPCVPNERYGILSPVEFLYRLQGDCDTRTVLLFTLLANLGYEPLIINSDEYAHSMLALNISASGDYFLYKGKRYAFWETTNTGWLPGMIPPSMNNKNYWNVVLDIDQL